MNFRLIKYVYCIKKEDICVGGVFMMYVDLLFFLCVLLKYRWMLKLCVKKVINDCKYFCLNLLR